VPTVRLNPALLAFECSMSGERTAINDVAGPVGLCGCCPPPGKPLVAIYDLAAVGALASSVASRSRGLWRFAPLLPIIEVPEGYADDVGDTPTFRAARFEAELDVELHVKREGSNPSGSFKDRGLAVGVALGAALGARRFCLPTQGNAGVAACLFSARLGLPGCLVYMPEAWRGSVYHRSCTLFGGEVRFAGSNVAEAGTRMRAELAAGLASGEVIDMSTFFEPGRLEGKKTMGLEIAEHFGAGALPDVIVYPTGGGTGLVGIWKAFEELLALGRLGGERLPRLVAVQSERCAPVVEAFERGLDHVEPVVSQGTAADGLDVPSAIMGHGILAAIRASRGTAAAVSEEAITAAFRASGAAGLSTSLEGAATLAAARLLRLRGEIAPGSRVLLLHTASHAVHVNRVNVA
jgi:threonine synthase